MVDVRLYLPKDWCNDPDRCKEAGIPESNRIFKTKIEIAYEILKHQIELGTDFDFIGTEVLPIHRTTIGLFLIDFYYSYDDVISCYITGNNSKSYSGF